ncbi:hypothetical protein TRFO_42502 [Tritrichomonas foetus]|uniref:Uncharacterized protein n=1 Tax=Tritrichomonas foetus TaxID=1144522 RepID=A0A1J4KWA5_9EUKA|nr:hypothetical protein TRFO_42502 [Tritrichomonas foetus]|eukprot:OHT15426.1 hypothetical protein TRFO_42502 [Tritrichomonas foetus]
MKRQLITIQKTFFHFYFFQTSTKMTKVYSTQPDNGMKICVSKEVMSRQIVSCVAVLRPLDCPSTSTKYGKVLSHSAVLIRTEKEFVMVEYMNVCKVLINRVGCLKKDEDISGDNFIYRGYLHKFISTVQHPKCPVTVREFAEKMVDIMKDRKFDTFTHNCHHARFLTMKHYGMRSEDPYNIKRNVLFQGIVDYFKKY